MTQNRSKPATTIKREQRLAAALRENLKKRKHQARNQASGHASDQAKTSEKPADQNGTASPKD
ncbi:MAG: hypothetical protein ABI439_05005 [Rhodospirillales bacterium]